MSIFQSMCMQCMLGAMSSMAAANGTRAWLGKRHFAWLTAARLRKVTVVLFGAALIASALLMSGSGAAHH
jgi:polyferredoxin